MPEYLVPGVYLEEIDTTPKPIPGVSTSTDDWAIASRLVAAMRPVLDEAEPEWAQFNDADPGITLIQLFAWMSEAMLYRSDAGSSERRKAVLRTVQALTQAAAICATEDVPLRRPEYFTGQLLDVATLQMEQNYHREKARRHNRNLHGCGIVSGLGLHIETAADMNDAGLVIEPGYAIDPCGEELAIPASVRIRLPPSGDTAFVSLRQCDRPCALAPSRLDTVAAQCTEEACLISIASVVPPRGVGIARLTRADSCWSLAADYLPQRSRQA